MELRLYDTLAREKRPFVPLNPARVRMYVCGPTVYDFAHIGNARPVIVFDVLFRLLRHVYGADHVTYVRNITDVDDKINARAAERGVSIRELTEQTYAEFKADVAALGCLPPTVEPRATEHVAEMRAIIERLVASGHAYVAEDHVLFSVPSMPDYGKLSKRPLDEMIAGARVDVAPYKRDAMDFVLWKPSKPGEPGWPSPSGISAEGRPGWHIECSAMSWKHLGETFDIHGGGIDLVFPHHENEIAQSCCAFGTTVMAATWMHNGFLQVEGEKMSKSLGNFVTIREVLKDWPGDVARLAMLSTHYRQPINWTLKGLEEAHKALGSFFDAASADAEPRPAPAVLDALADDLNTPMALAAMHGLKNAAGRRALAGTLAFFGFRADALKAWEAEHEPAPPIPAAEIEARVAARIAARQAKNFAESDRIRDELLALGVVLKDSKDGTTWSVAR
ncbi:MAG: cysteine--tRNA ligase [Rhodoplanes sp.]|uniref:cysteine--tRNA ligase n=1 Tax=Rhodoplanes sp. TaxID=1968906 RepID=UPI0017FA666C|nr:cysteine--tRNA ligase [Rhodoplanes sp.]NVO14814.1 cysteine--tRNA ligase [Rhodoplanes sp.]